MQPIENYYSATVAGSGNQKHFSTEGEIRVGRVFYKLRQGGAGNYRLFFTNTVDSTYGDGSESRANLVCTEWKLHRAAVGICRRELFGAALVDGKRYDIENACSILPLTFEGKTEKTVAAGEAFCSDPVYLEPEVGEYLCLELQFSGEMIPCHTESLLPAFCKEGGEWVRCVDQPFVGMIGYDRPHGLRLGFLGDSITQGIGTPFNSYLHWNVLVADRLDDDVAVWNLGLGFGRASDMASNGAWLQKAKQNDAVVLCCGVNDIIQGGEPEQIKGDIATVVRLLKESGLRVLLQTVPPFVYNEARRAVWESVNGFLRRELASQADVFFDNVALLGEENDPAAARYGGHPNEEGSRIWAKAILPSIQKLIEIAKADKAAANHKK